MKFLFASDSFKGSLSSEEIGKILTKTSKQIFPDCQTAVVTVADGGEGTLDAMVSALNGSIRKVEVHGPLMEPFQSHYGVFDDGKAIIEVATVAGLPLVPEQLKNPLNTTSYGLGELIKDAMEQGYRDITIGLGGSATNDGGTGALSALGVRFYDKEGMELTGFGKDLNKIVSIDVSTIHPLIKDTRFIIMSDVTNPFTGCDGATYTYGMQKGGTDDILEVLELGMLHFKNLISNEMGIDLNDIVGSGAAGGLGGSLTAFLQAEMKSGIDTVLEMVRFDSALEGVDLVVTGEGRMDWQSAFGKVPSGVGNRCKIKGIPVVAVVGGMGKGANDLYEHGIDSIITTVNSIMTIGEAIGNAEELYENAAIRMFRMLKINLGE